MSRIIRDNSAFLHLLMCSDTPKAQAKALLDTISKMQLNALTEIAFNLLKGTIKITENHKSSLRRYAGKLRILSKTKLPTKSKKDILTPTFVASLLRAVAPSLK